MPGFDRTGPRSMGPMTGGGRGLCNPRGIRPDYLGYGFGFRGAAPARPYVGRGRGGLPRCWYPGVAMASPYPPVSSVYTPQMTQEGEIGWLKNQAEAIKAEFDRVEARIHDLESAK